jgi:hypothetical protein
MAYKLNVDHAACAVAWRMNLDAEQELRNPVGYMPSPTLVERTAALIDRIPDLVQPGDVLLGVEPEALPHAERYLGLCWCPTATAQAALERAGVRPAPAPSFEVLRAANHRRFCAELGQTLAGARFCDSPDEVRACMADGGVEDWLLKRAFGFSGRGRRPVRASRLIAADHSWIEASCAAGFGLQVEPRLEVLFDVVQHGLMLPDGRALLGAPMCQRCTPKGAWIETRRVGGAELAADEREVLGRATDEVVQGLRALGYFGPFGIDAFRYRDAGGRRGFQPRSELNARLTMGWALGMGAAASRLRAGG